MQFREKILILKCFYQDNFLGYDFILVLLLKVSDIPCFFGEKKS